MARRQPDHSPPFAPKQSSDKEIDFKGIGMKAEKALRINREANRSEGEAGEE